MEELVERRRSRYCGSQKDALLASDGQRSFFKNVKNYKSCEKSEGFDVSTLFPGKTEKEVAEELAKHFNAISNEFEPLEPHQIPCTKERRLPTLEPFQVAGRIKAFKKPKSMVKGDIFPKLMTIFCDLLAIPLSDIYNQISRSFVWPKIWKEEYVTVIPKKKNPTSLNDLRNISCTKLASKIYESYVLGWAADYVKIKRNQFGGVKGCSVTHFLIHTWQRIVEDLEDCRAGALLTSIDYAKAFNRLSYQQCLKSLASKGASSEVIRLIATFSPGSRTALPEVRSR